VHVLDQVADFEALSGVGEPAGGQLDGHRNKNDQKINKIG
jgi:hypothetical protein